MSGVGGMSVSGLASGLDTQSIIAQLMRLERQPVVQLQSRQTQLQTAANGWSTLTSAITGVRTALDRVADASALGRLAKVTSTQPDAVSVTGSGSGSGSLSFTVQALATAEPHASGAFTSRQALVGAGTLTLTKDGVEHRFTTDADTTLADLEAMLTERGVGVRAQIVAVGTDAHRLTITATQTGAVNAFTLSSDGIAGFERIQSGSDALLTVEGLEVRRSSNTIADLVDGATITLRRPSTGAVTVTAERDVDQVLSRTKALVDAVNLALGTIKNQTAYDPVTRRNGPLGNDPLARRLASDLRTALTGAVAELANGAGFGSQIGISGTRDGLLALDEQQLRSALTADWDRTVRILGRGGDSTDSRLTVDAVGAATATGSHQIQITRAATAAAATGTVFIPPPGDTQRFVVRTADNRVVEVTVPGGSDLAGTISAINAALQSRGVTSLTASAGSTDGGEPALRLTSSVLGRDGGFSLTSLEGSSTDVYGLITGYVPGEDVQGRHGPEGPLVTGRGAVLTFTDGEVGGLSVQVDARAADVPLSASVTVSKGLVGSLSDLLRTYEGTDGLLARSRSTVTNETTRITRQIEDYERRLESREATLRRQFTGLETALSRLASQGTWLTSQLAALQNLNTQR